MFSWSPSKALVAAILAQSLLSTASAQSTITVDGNTVPVDNATLAPAAAVVDGEQLFPVEQVQLTDEVIANLTDIGLNASLFDFGSDASASALDKRSGSCKVFPGDKLWPSPLVWTLLDLLSGGRLIATIPSASSCYNDWPKETNPTECAYVTDNWTNSYYHMEDPTSVMWPLWQGRTCLPTDDPTQNCTLGGYPSFALNVTNVAQIQLAVNFVRNSNMRLVVKNTGHDFNGKSSGAGALSIWTHHLKDIQYIKSYPFNSYKGPAVKIGAGVQAFELYEAGKKYGFTAVGGEGQTVGIGGGYIAGGGHSPMSSIYGIAADHVLAIEIVLPNGRFVTATESVNTELFWALRGGGGSTFGVVTSVTFKVFPVMKATAVQFSFGTSDTVSVDAFWAGVRAYFKYFIVNTDAGTYSYFSIVPTSPGNFLFNMLPFFAPNMTEAETKTLLAPWYADLAALGIDFAPTYFYGDNYYDAWITGFPLETVGGSASKTAARLFPRDNWADESTLNSTFDAIKYPLDNGGMLLGFNVAGAAHGTFPDNAVNPAWRTAVLHAIGMIFLTDPSPEACAAQAKILTTDWMQKWRDVTPGGGAYLNEGDVSEPNFQQSFYGESNYPRLYALKKALDPWGILYAPTAVGSEDWYVTDQIDWLPTQNGRVCSV